MNSETQEQPIILIVDDTLSNLEILSDFLDSAGFKVWAARDGESALRKVEYSLPDMILLDVMMPGIDGFETCKRLKANPSSAEVPVIFTTSLSDPLDKVKGLNLGAVDYMTKPFQEEEVLARVKLHLKLSFLTRALESQNTVLKQEISERTAAETALQKLKVELEERVEERTAQLSKSLQDLQQAQGRLVQSEKLSALGELVAGIAHEMNNPLGCIVGNLKHTSGYIQDLLNLIDIYQQNFPRPGAQIESEIEKIELEYLRQDLPEIMASMEESTERICKLSNSLRIFAREDMVNKVAFNIHEGLDSTLLILKHRLKGSKKRQVIEVVKKYNFLPLVECYPGQINQVFMNIIANAIDALDDRVRIHLSKGETVPYLEIAIATELSADEKHAIINIKDNGLGMPIEVQQKVFDHLFTTKPAEKGTGLGLSISREIVEEKHGGKLSCISRLGEGTEFAIELPVKLEL